MLDASGDLDLELEKVTIKRKKSMQNTSSGATGNQNTNDKQS